MKISARNALSIGTTVAFLTGCGGSQPPIGAPAAMLQSSSSSVPLRAAPQPQAHDISGAKRRLLYLGEWKLVDSNRVGKTLILSYPSGHKVATIRNYGPMCTDSSGNVYIQSTDALSEYAPGGTSPIGQASLPGGVSGYDCAVDATTGDISVCGWEGVSSNSIGWVGVYSSLNKAPTVFTNDKTLQYYYCGYDDAGNLFLDGFCDCNGGFSELPAGDDQFVNFSGTVFLFGPVQWDGQYITVEDAWKGRQKNGSMKIWQLAVSGSSVKVVGTTYIEARGADEAQYTWIEGSTVVKPYGRSQKNDEVGYWPYPEGGSKPYKVLKGFEYVEYPLISTSYRQLGKPNLERFTSP